MVKTSSKKREVGLQSIIQPKYYDSPHILAAKNLETVEYSKYFYVSHTLTFLVLGLLAVNIFANYGTYLSGIDHKTLGICV